MSSASRIILGLDPGSRKTGYAVLKCIDNRFEALECGLIRAEKLEDHADRLKLIQDEVTRLIRKYNPQECAVETPVYGKDPLAMLKLGRAQAACILAIVNEDITVTEYYPKAVKKAITGNGNADKGQVAYMLARLVNMPDQELGNDETDALAVAWCHSVRGGKDVINQNPMKPGRRGKKGWAAFVESNPDRVK